MAIEDFKNTTVLKQVIAPQLLTATTTNATGQDFLLGDGNCWLEVHLGTWSATSLTVQVQQSTTTNANFTDITGASVTATTNTTPILVSEPFQRDYRYLRVIATMSGTTIGLSAVLGESAKVL